VSPTLATISRANEDTATEMASIEYDLQRYYGLSFESYAEVRNHLLEKHNGILDQEVLHNYLFNGIVIDLVGAGYLRLQNNCGPNDVKYKMTLKGSSRVIHALGEKIEDLPEEPYQALIFLRNMNLLETTQ